jgi:DNA-binding LacI/PurR family transcriptional regulator
MTIGVLFPDIGNPFYFEVLRGIEKKLYDADFNIMLCNSDYDDAKELRYISLLASKKVDGIIAAPCSERSKGIALLKKWDIPFVLIDIPQVDFKTNGVFVDHANCSYMATNFLIKNGHKKIVVIDAKRNPESSSKFTEGYLRSLKENNIMIDHALMIDTYPDINNGYLVIKELIKNKIDFSAVTTINDLLSVGVYRAVAKYGLRIPDDISVIGNDNIPLSKFLNPPLTTINQPKLLLGYKSAELLLKYIKEKENPFSTLKTITLDVKLIQRKSVRDKNHHEKI